MDNHLVSVWYGNEVSKYSDPKTWGWRVLESKISTSEAKKLKIEYENKGYQVRFEKAW